MNFFFNFTPHFLKEKYLKYVQELANYMSWKVLLILNN